MTSKKIIAFMLTVCMLLTCMPAFAAEITLGGDTVFPEEGFEVKFDRHFWENGGTNLLIVVNSKHNDLFPFRAARDHYKGIAVSFNGTQKNPPAGSVAEFTVEDAEVYYTRTSGDGQLCLGIYPDELIASSPELSALKAEGKTNAEIIDMATTENFSTITNSVINQGTWKAETINTDPFTEGTLFLSHQAFAEYPSTWQSETRGDYTGIWYPSSLKNNGPMQFFVPEETAEYNVYAQIITNQAYPVERTVHVGINGEEFEFTPGSVETSLLPTGMDPAWIPETDAKTVTLTKDEVTRVQILYKQAYSRLATLAFIPVNDYATVSAALAASPSTRVIEPNEVATLAEPVYHPDFETGEITVTVDGQTVATTAGKAAKNVNNVGYIAAASLRVKGFPVRVLPETNTFPTYPTVFDAIAKYISDVQVSDPIINIGGITNGAIPGKAVFVNGKLISGDLDWYEIKEGDVITFANKDRKDTFDPTSIKGFQDIDTNGAGLIQAIGTPTKEDAYDETGKLKLCLNQANTASALGSFATAYDETGLKDCYLVGYLTMRKNNSNAFTGLNNGANWTNIAMDSKVYFENTPILGYDTAPNTTRVDIVTGGKVGYGSRYPYYVDPSNTITNENGEYLMRPYEYFGDGYLYNWSNVYFVNSSTDVSLKAAKSANGYTLTTGGMHVVDVVIATYAEDGKTVTNTEVMKEQIVMFNDSLNIPVAANQKAFVWGTKIYEGTTMKPAMAPLVGSNFAN